MDHDTVTQPPRKVKKTLTKRRIGSEQSATRLLLLNITEHLMRSEGYAAVSSRRVAKEAGVKPSLVHYYFPTTDDLFLALFRRAAEDETQKQDAALNSDNPLNTLWGSYRNRNRTALAVEFMALANHRKAIQNEIAQYTERTRQHRIELLKKHLKPNHNTDPASCSAAALSVLLVGVARTLVMEEALGISVGHQEAKVYIDQLLQQLQSNSD